MLGAAAKEPLNVIASCCNKGMAVIAKKDSTIDSIKDLYQPSKRLTHYGPIAIANGGDASGLGSEAAPSVLAGIENGLVANTRLERKFWRKYCQMFSCALSSGLLGGSGSIVMLAGSMSLSVVCQPA